MLSFKSTLFMAALLATHVFHVFSAIEARTVENGQTQENKEKSIEESQREGGMDNTKKKNKGMHQNTIRALEVVAGTGCLIGGGYYLLKPAKNTLAPNFRFFVAKSLGPNSSGDLVSLNGESTMGLIMDSLIKKFSPKKSLTELDTNPGFDSDYDNPLLLDQSRIIGKFTKENKYKDDRFYIFIDLTQEKSPNVATFNFIFDKPVQKAIKILEEKHNQIYFIFLTEEDPKVVFNKLLLGLRNSKAVIPSIGIPCGTLNLHITDTKCDNAKILQNSYVGLLKGFNSDESEKIEKLNISPEMAIKKALGLKV